jgi:hypothetical protein
MNVIGRLFKVSTNMPWWIMSENGTQNGICGHTRGRICNLTMDQQRVPQQRRLRRGVWLTVCVHYVDDGTCWFTDLSQSPDAATSSTRVCCLTKILQQHIALDTTINNTPCFIFEKWHIFICAVGRLALYELFEIQVSLLSAR